jgi:hypothetical protein
MEKTGGHYSWNWGSVHHRNVSISGERAGARSVASRQHVFGSPRCNDDLRQLPSDRPGNASQRSKVSKLCRHCQPTDNHCPFFETVPSLQPQPNAKIRTVTRRYRRRRRLYPQHQAEIAINAAARPLMRRGPGVIENPTTLTRTKRTSRKVADGQEAGFKLVVVTRVTEKQRDALSNT